MYAYAGTACSFSFPKLRCVLRTQHDPEDINLSSCSTQLSMKLIKLKNVKMSTIVGILKFMSMINTTSKGLKARSVFIIQHFSFQKSLKFHAHLS